MFFSPSNRFSLRVCARASGEGEGKGMHQVPTIVMLNSAVLPWGHGHGNLPPRLLPTPPPCPSRHVHQRAKEPSSTCCCRLLLVAPINEKVAI